jgi:hypothetical protein
VGVGATDREDGMLGVAAPAAVVLIATAPAVIAQAMTASQRRLNVAVVNRFSIAFMNCPIKIMALWPLKFLL